MSRVTRVLIIDDSAVVRKALTQELSRHPGIEVCGTAADPYIAREKIAELNPDALTLDIEMPRMDGLTFLRKLMQHHPIPTVVISSVTPAGCDTALACLEAGAVEVLSKPSTAYSIGDLGKQLSRLLQSAASIKLQPRLPIPQPRRCVTKPAAINTTNRIIAIGASTGGTDALTEVMSGLPKNSPGILITQHMPAGFTASFAKRLNEVSGIFVQEAQGGEIVGPGMAFLAPGNKHLKLVRDGAVYRTSVVEGPRVCRHRPSVEVLFDSVAESAGANSIGVILTGMGEDGAGGMKNMLEAGAHTIAQDEKTCVVFGMPRAAIECGGVKDVLPLRSIAEKIISVLSSNRRFA